jgi:hypothetical protein
VLGCGHPPRAGSVVKPFQTEDIVMSDTIVLDSNHREVVRGIAKDSSVLCSATSAPDVYVHVITQKDTAELHKGDGTIIPKMTRTRFHLFRNDPGDDPFSATVTVTDLPASPTDKSNSLMAAFRLIKHKPNAFKIKTAKKAAKKTSKKKVKRKTVKKKKRA